MVYIKGAGVSPVIMADVTMVTAAIVVVVAIAFVVSGALEVGDLSADRMGNECLHLLHQVGLNQEHLGRSMIKVGLLLMGLVVWGLTTVEGLRR